MSVWTHVIGSFTMYDVPKEKDNNAWRKEILKRFYKNISNNQPLGSEGGLQWSLSRVTISMTFSSSGYWDNEDSWVDNRDTYVFNVFGDLRDYQDTREIEEWIKGIIYDPKYSVRDAIFKIDCDCNDDDIILNYNFDEKCKRNEEFDKIIDKWS